MVLESVVWEALLWFVQVVAQLPLAPVALGPSPSLAARRFRSADCPQTPQVRASQPPTPTSSIDHAQE
eukprot:4464305-Amphidinium_carterae.1